MKKYLKSPELIEYFGTDELTSEFLDEFDEYKDRTLCIDVDLSNYTGYKVFNEIISIRTDFPNLKNMGFFCRVHSGKDVESVLELLPKYRTDFISIAGNLNDADFSLLSSFSYLTELKIIQDDNLKKINFPQIALPKKMNYLTIKNVKLPSQINSKNIEYLSQGEKKPITIILNDVSELSLKQLDEIEKKYQIQKIGIARYPEENNEGLVVDSYYTAGEYRIILNRLLELIDGIDIDLPDNKKVKELYLRVAENINYDNQLAEKDRVPLEARNLKNALMYNEAVCVGYANVIKEACSLLGIYAVMVHGKVRTRRGTFME